MRATLGCFVLAALLCLPACDSGTVNTCSGPSCPDGGGNGDGGVGFQDGLTPVGDGGAGDGGGASCQGGPPTCGNTCCTADQACVADKCETLGPQCGPLWPCPTGFFCDDTRGRCVPGANVCEYRPPTGVFAPKLKWAWTGSNAAPTYNQVMMTPMVANLTDDNNDGKIDQNDVPDIVFHTFAGGNYKSDGVLRVISGDGKGDHFSITAAAYRTAPGTEIAIGDIDGDGKPEIVACRSGGGVLAFENDGTFKWQSDLACTAPAIADLDGDGKPEVVTCYSALDGATGATIFTARAGCVYTAVADVDHDGMPEIVGGNAIVSHDGKVQWETTAHADGFPAIADLDGDGKPEIVVAVNSEHALYAHRGDGSAVWGPVDINQGQATGTDKCDHCGGGPPTIADFDGDGKPEIATAGGWGYVVFENDGSPKWFKATKDLSSRVTGSSVFDFEGDGSAEVVYSDEHELRIYEGKTGKVLWSTCNTSGTLREYPLIVDVDNDDHAEIVVANNNYAFKTCSDGKPSSTGIKVFGDSKNNWVRTRRIWNQHTYHVTNVNEDGTIPAKPDRNWANPHLNNFRQNVQPGGLFDAPDLSGSAGASQCGTRVTVSFDVQNRGAARVTPGVNVTLYHVQSGGTRAALATVQTTTTIDPGQSETVTFDVPRPAGVGNNQSIDLVVVVDDDGSGNGAINECDEMNNETALAPLPCKSIN